MTERQVWCAGGAIILAAIAIAGIDLSRIDFTAFYESGLRWRGVAVPTSFRPDLNPPTFGLLIVPFTFLPLPAAFALWTTLGFLSLIDALVQMHQHRALSRQRLVWTAIALCGFMPCLSVWVEGQVTWLLLYPMTRAWLARDPREAGFWLAPVIAVKPPLALMALCLPLQTWVMAGAVSGAISAFVVALTGWAPWQAWLELSRTITWLHWPNNISLWGTAARLQDGGLVTVSMATLDSRWVPVVLAAGLVLMWRAARAAGDRRWMLALLASLALSPLGWIYYLPLALGPALVSWTTTTPVARAAIILLAIPMPILFVLASVFPQLAGSAYFLGATFAFVSVNHSVNRETTRHDAERLATT